MLPPWIALPLVLIAAGAVLVVAIAVLAGSMIVRPPRMTDGKALYRLKRIDPADLGLPFEPMAFVVRDARTGAPLKLAAWWLPAPSPSSRTTILIHGYADAKVGGLAWAPTLLACGTNVLAIDLRAHGHSDGAYTTAGSFERHDVDQLIDQLHAARLEATRELILFGVSLGAAVATATAALRSASTSPPIVGLVLDSPFASFTDAALVHGRRWGMPGGIVHWLAMAWAQWLCGASFDAVGPPALLPGVQCSVLIIAGRDDPYFDAPAADAFAGTIGKRESAGRATELWAGDFGHVTGLATAPQAYAAKLRQFFTSIPSTVEHP